MKFEKINSKHQIQFEPSPNEADLAIVSIDSEGNLGQLNEYVLIQYGYSIKDLPKKENLARAGFGAIPDTKGKPILFVVTIDNKREPITALEENLYNTLAEFRGWFRNKKVWLPLMGTGSGKLTFEESYSATAKAINRFQGKFPTEVDIIISLPTTEKAKALYESIKRTTTKEETSAEEFLKSLNCKFYVVGSIWDSVDQAERFLKENIWEKGHDDESYEGIIYEINIGDVLIIKSTFATKDGENYLRVKALGIVIEASDDGASVIVDWRIKELKIDVAGLGFFRNTIAQANLEDAVKIFSFIDQTLWKRLLPPSTTPINNSSKIAGLISDSEKGIDYLDISKDVTAFARVIAAKSFEPPLAIALFGKWGSGKSFFMRLLKEQITAFSNRTTSDMYCKGVVHIQFNAWSYMDANLWASFVSKIFEGLQEYIKKDNSSKQLISNIKEELSKQLNITKVGIEVLQEKKATVEKQIENLEIKRTKIRKEVEQKIESLKNRTAWDVLNNIDQQFDAKKKIIESLQANPTFVKTEVELKKIIPEKYWDNPKEAYEQIKSKHTFLKEFFRREKVVANLCWLGVILSIIFLAPIILEVFSVQISKTNFLIPQAGISFLIMLGAVWKRAEVVYLKLQPIAASFWKIKTDYEQLRDEALSKFQQEEKALKLEIEKGKAEILLFTEQIQKAQTVFAELDYKINNALATETLYSFIEERSKSEDYKKHLGIISTIRKDFEILNGLFIDHKSELVNQQEAEKFRKYFTKPVERIILYVDDLDRCPEENVVQVLEAVNLLMAFPLFIVIVGVDPRWVKNALIKKYALQFTGKMNGSDIVETGIELIEPSNYLEKIFQIPFHLKDAPPQSVREMIRQLAVSKPIMPLEAQKNAQKNITDKAEAGDKTENLPVKGNSVKVAEIISATDEITATIHENIELLELTELEIELMQDMGEIIGPNPRALKRFVNIYRIIKAHEDYTVSPSAPKEDLLAVLFLLALSIGQFKKLVPSFEIFIGDDKNIDKPITLYLQPVHNLNELQDTKHKLDVILSDQTSYQNIQQTKASIFNGHNTFIKRFTFKNI